jgi:hypothetical protein
MGTHHLPTRRIRNGGTIPLPKDEPRNVPETCSRFPVYGSVSDRPETPRPFPQFRYYPATPNRYTSVLGARTRIQLSMAIPDSVGERL